MNRVTLYLSIGCVLGLANAVVWAREGRQMFAGSQAFLEGCNGCSASAKEAEARRLLLATKGKGGGVVDLGLPVRECTGCTVIMTDTQTWCKLRPPNTECWIGPGLDNFRWERPLTIYQCSDMRLGICCGSWVLVGCCNDSQAQPSCSHAEVDFNCEEAPNCP